MSDKYYASKYCKYEVTHKGDVARYKSLRVFADDDGISRSTEVDHPPERADSPLREQTFFYRELEAAHASRLKEVNLFKRILDEIGDFAEAIDGLYVRLADGMLAVTMMLKEDFMEDNVEGIIREGVREMLDEIIYNI